MSPTEGAAPPVAGPVPPGTGARTRAGNAMARTRLAVLAGALRAVEQAGTRRTTMSDVAALGGVAKATVYNHFRTKTDVLDALVEAEVRGLAEECVRRAGEARERDGLAEAVEHAAVRLSEHRALRSVAASEPDVLARLLVPGDRLGWPAARDAVGQVLRATGRQLDADSVDTVLRVVASHLAWPSGRAAAAAAADALVRALPAGAVDCAADGAADHAGEQQPAPPVDDQPTPRGEGQPGPEAPG